MMLTKRIRGFANRFLLCLLKTVRLSEHKVLRFEDDWFMKGSVLPEARQLWVRLFAHAEDKRHENQLWTVKTRFTTVTRAQDGFMMNKNWVVGKNLVKVMNQNVIKKSNLTSLFLNFYFAFLFFPKYQFGMSFHVFLVLNWSKFL